MPAMEKPRTGSVPEKQGVTQPKTEALVDVKQTVSEPSKETKPKAEVKVEPEVELDDADLTALSDSNQKVPYGRFREVNERKKALETEIASLQSEFDRKLQREIEAAENRAFLKASQKQQDDSVMDLEPWDKKIHGLTKELEGLKSQLQTVNHESQRARLEVEIGKLESKYPDADTVSVLAKKRVAPHMDLEDLMEQSHRAVNDKVEKKMRDLLESKKKKSREAIPPMKAVGMGLRPEEKPQTIGAVSKFLRKNASFFNSK